MFNTLMALNGEQVQFIGWSIAILSALLTIYFARKAKPVEKLTLDLNIIQTRNEFLEKRTSELEDKEERNRKQIDDCNTDIALLREENKSLKEVNKKNEAIIEAHKAELMEMQTQVINSQVSASLMRNQVMIIARKYQLPESLSDLRRGEN